VSIEAIIPLDAGWIERALLLSDEAGWNQTAADWAAFMAHGAVLGVVADDRLVATAAALPYGREFGWVSMVLVSQDWRGRGIATRLAAACTSLLRDAGSAAFLDATPAGAAVYARLGFVPLCAMQRWQGQGGAAHAPGATADLSLDRLAFGADRRFLLEDFLSRPGSLGFASQGSFALLRQGARAMHVGPAVGEPAAALPLVMGALAAARGTVLVDVLEAAYSMIPALAAQGFRMQRRFTRMALGRTALPGNPARLLAAAGPEFG